MRVSLTISLLTLALLIACAPSPRGQSNSELSRSNVTIEKLAIVPFLKVSNDASLREGAAIVERHFAELLSKQVLLIIPSRDVALALDGLSVKPQEAAKICATAFGVDSILTGKIRRFTERKGAPLGATAPASVAFDVAIYDAPNGRRIWSAIFDEKQKAMTNNFLVARRYPGKGTRWLSRVEFTKWGISEIIDELPLGDLP